MMIVKSIYTNLAIRQVGNIGIYQDHTMDYKYLCLMLSTHLKENGRLIISCGGEGNAAQILATFAELTASDNWKDYFNNFYNPYFFYGVKDYRSWLKQAGFNVKRLELVPKDMTHHGKEEFAGWIRTTWMPFTKYVPEEKRDRFIAQFVDLYLANNPLDEQGLTHVSMVRLEVDAYKT